ncbi:MAG TPA: hypothetical protein VMG12_41450 [Polyangiaceae bacterium]|nr:hypothetical protein [Polyangiaceae bacterium]
MHRPEPVTCTSSLPRPSPPSGANGGSGGDAGADAVSGDEEGMTQVEYPYPGMSTYFVSCGRAPR